MSDGPAWAERGIERTIREAQERGDFDDLPGAGKPLDLGNPHDPDWWVKQLIQREQLSLVDALPPAVGLRREAEQFPGSLLRLGTERQVREHLEDFNERVAADWRRPAVGPTSPVVAYQVDVERVAGQWREQVAASRSASQPARQERATKRRWWHLRRPVDQGDA